jgi:hypothetical protein
MKIGDTVGLKVKVRKQHICPFGRQDNKTAHVKEIFGEDKDQVMLDRDLHGCKYWNMKDLDRLST